MLRLVKIERFNPNHSIEVEDTAEANVNLHRGNGFSVEECLIGLLQMSAVLARELGLDRIELGLVAGVSLDAPGAAGGQMERYAHALQVKSVLHERARSFGGKLEPADRKGC